MSRQLSDAVLASTVLLVFALSPHRAFAQNPTEGPGSGVCVAVMAATMTGVDGDAAAAGAAVRDLFVSFLTGPSIQPLALESRLRVQAMEEAKQKDCAYIVGVAMSKKRGGSSRLGSALGQAAGTASWYIPGGSGTAAVARGVSAGAARAVSDLASTTRAKDEMTIEWTLTPLAAQGRASSPHSEKLKARSDGEDLMTPLVQRAAETVAETVLRK